MRITPADWPLSSPAAQPIDEPVAAPAGELPTSLADAADVPVELTSRTQISREQDLGQMAVNPW